jgi:BTB/POZ domain
VRSDEASDEAQQDVLGTNDSTGLFLRKLFDEQLFTDVELHMSDGILRAHRSVLALNSTVFFTMLTIEMTEAAIGIVRIPDINVATMNEVMRFIYCKELQNIDGIIGELIYAAEKYDVVGLKKRCFDLLIQNIEVDNVVSVLSVVDNTSDSEKVLNACVLLITQ